MSLASAAAAADSSASALAAGSAPMPAASVGFAVIYRWKLNAGLSEQFVSAWSKVTLEILAHDGGMGSRLHLADEGVWTAYAQWPDRAAWERAQGREKTPEQKAIRALVSEAIAESFPPMLLTPVADHLVRAPIKEVEVGAAEAAVKARVTD